MEEKTRVLVVDDEKYILQLFRRALEVEGFDVTTVADGEAALSLFKEIEPHIILLDIKMPKLDGYSVLERIRETSPVPVIMLTATPEEDGVRRCFDLGADDYIRKPFLTSVVVARIKAKLRLPKNNIKKPSPRDSN